MARSKSERPRADGITLSSLPLISIREISNAFRNESGEEVRFVVISSGILDLIRMMLLKDVEEDYIEEYFNEKIGNRVSISDIVNIVSFIYQAPKNICIKEVGL